MTTSQPPDFHLNRPGVLIAALPAVLGFVPEKSLVLVTVDCGEMGCVMRVDLSDELLYSLGHVADVAAAAKPDSAIAVVVDEQGFGCRMCADEYRQLAAVLTASLAERGIELLAAHVVDRVAAGGRWHCADGCGNSGTVDDPSASPLAVAAVLDGRRLYARRAELQDVINVVDPARRAALADVIRDRQPDGAERADAEARSDIEDAIAAAGLVVDGRELSDDELARLAWALKDPRVRDTLYALAVGENAGQAESLWAVLSRTLPDPWRVEALVLLAFSAYVRGDGPLAGVSLEAALRCDPTHRMAGMLDTALQSGMRPEQIRELAVTGYRLADQLGVRLPPKRAFGRRAGYWLDLLDLDRVGHVMRQLDLLVAGDHDHDATIVVALHGDSRVGYDAGVLQPGDEFGVALDVFGELAHHDRDGHASRQLGEPHQVDLVAGEVVADAELGQARDRVAERRGGGVVENLHQAALDVLAHHMFPAARLGVHFFPGQPDHVDE